MTRVRRKSKVHSYRGLQAEGQLTLATRETDCRQCCEVLSDARDVAACQDIGCGSNDNCFNDGATTQACLNGRDFLLSGASRVEGVELRCSGGRTEGFEGFGAVPSEVEVDDEAESNCRSCCTAVDNQLDSSNVFNSGLCSSACRGRKNCFNEGNFDGRFACFVGSDLLSVGRSGIRVGEGEIQNVECASGELILLEVGDNGNEDETNDSSGGGGGAAVGVLVSLIVLALLGLFVFKKQKSSPEAEANEYIKSPGSTIPVVAAVEVEEEKQNEEGGSPSLMQRLLGLSMNRRNRGSFEIIIQGLGGVVNRNPARRGERSGDGERRISGIAPPGRSFQTSSISNWFHRLSIVSAPTRERDSTRALPIRRINFLPNRSPNPKLSEVESL